MTQERQKSIAALLRDYMATNQHTGNPFCWQTNNCGQFALDWWEVVTGLAPMDGLPVTKDARAVAKMIRSLGGDMVHAVSVRTGTEPISPALAQLGDVLVVRCDHEGTHQDGDGNRFALGICGGGVAMLLGHFGGTVYVPMTSAVAAFRPVRGGA